MAESPDWKNLDGLSFRDEDHFVEVALMAEKHRRAEERARYEARLARFAEATRDVFGAALPNAIGTVVGGLLLALLAALSGVIEHVSVYAWVLMANGVLALALGIVGYANIRENTLKDEDELRDQYRAQFREWVKLGLLTQREGED